MAEPKWEKAQAKGPGKLVMGGAFGQRTIAKGVKVKYSISGYGHRHNSDPDIDIRWVVTYHYGKDDAKDPIRWQKSKDDSGNRSSAPVFEFEWDRVGHHRVHCLTFQGGKPFVKLEVDQRVEEMWAILETEWNDAKKRGTPHPVTELQAIRKYRDLIWDLGLKYGVHDEMKHAARIRELNSYAAKLEEMLAKCDQSLIIPFKAVYLATGSMELAELRVFLTRPKGSTTELMVVDWTNLDEPKLSDTYKGAIPEFNPHTGDGAGSRAPTPTPTIENEGQLWQDGVRNAVTRWEKKNGYWPGGVEYSILATHEKSGLYIKIEGTFKTGNKSAAESLVDWLGKIARGAGMLLLLATPGSALFGALLFATVVAGTTAAYLSIHHRRANGQSDFLADAMDVLDIMANVFGVAHRAGAAVLWRAGRTVALESAGQKVVKALFIGQTWANGVNGVLLGVSFVDRYNKIFAMTHVTPDERAKMMLDLLGEASTKGAMHFVNQKVASAKEKADFHKLLEHDAIPRPINDGGGSDGSGGKKPPSGGSGGKGTPDSLPKHVDDQESGFHVVPSDGVPRRGDDGPVSGSGPTSPVQKPPGTTIPVQKPPSGTDATVPVKTPQKPNDPDKTAPIRTDKPDPDKTAPIKVTDKPGFPAKTNEREKKVTAITRQNKQTPAGVRPQPSPDATTGGKHKNGVPPEVFKDGRYLLLGLWNKDPKPWDWLKNIKAKDATTVRAYDQGNPIYISRTGQRIPDDNPVLTSNKRGFYQSVVEVSLGVIRGVNKHEGRAILFDLTGMEAQKSLTRGTDAKSVQIYDRVSSHELRYIRDNWASFDPPPRFFADGKEVPRPW